MRDRLSISACLIFIFAGVAAQDGFTVRHDSLRSEILQQTRSISIFLPEGYETGNTKFPVIYVLDADGRDQHTVPTARFLFLNNKMPKVIIVGIMNIDRNHDFLPDSSQNAPTGGGADNFMKFFRQELIPYVDKNFRTESYKVLIGHSYGGLFAMHVLLSEPDLFDSYIAIDPSFWYKNQLLIKRARTELTLQKNWNHTIFITGREGNGMDEMGINSMEKLLTSTASKELNWKIAAYPDEDHGSVPFKSVYDGLRFIFDPGTSYMIYPQSGIIPAGKSIYAFIGNINPDLRYTLDGTEPTTGSPAVKATIKISGGHTLKIKSVSKKYKNSPASSYVFTEGGFLTGQKPAVDLKPGLKYAYYEGTWDSLPDFTKINPVKNGITEIIDLNMAVKKDSFAIKYEGYLKIAKKDIYYLWIMSDDGSELYLNGRLIINNDGLHSADAPKITALPLNPGYYPIEIRYFDKNGGKSITAGMLKVGKTPTPQPLRKESLFHKE